MGCNECQNNQDNSKHKTKSRSNIQEFKAAEEKQAQFKDYRYAQIP